MKRSTFIKYGQWQSGPSVGTTDYFLRIALGGEINGWYYPFVLQEHMDDPKSTFTVLRSDSDVRQWYDVTYVLREHNIRDMQSRLKRRDTVLENLNSGPWDAKWYVGWRRYWLKLLRYQRKILSFRKIDL